MSHQKRIFGHAFRYMPVTPALGRLRQESHNFEATLSYTTRPCLSKTTLHPNTMDLWLGM
jgi:hypothetical protein